MLPNRMNSLDGIARHNNKVRRTCVQCKYAEACNVHDKTLTCVQCKYAEACNAHDKTLTCVQCKYAEACNVHDKTLTCVQCKYAEACNVHDKTLTFTELDYSQLQVGSGVPKRSDGRGGGEGLSAGPSRRNMDAPHFEIFTEGWFLF